jgi:hypothetical protein
MEQGFTVLGQRDPAAFLSFAHDSAEALPEAANKPRFSRAFRESVPALALRSFTRPSRAKLAARCSRSS